MRKDRIGFVPRSGKCHNNILLSTGVFDECQEWGMNFYELLNLRPKFIKMHNSNLEVLSYPFDL